MNEIPTSLLHRGQVPSDKTIRGGSGKTIGGGRGIPHSLSKFDGIYGATREVTSVNRGRVPKSTECSRSVVSRSCTTDTESVAYMESTHFGLVRLDHVKLNGAAVGTTHNAVYLGREGTFGFVVPVDHRLGKPRVPSWPK